MADRSGGDAGDVGGVMRRLSDLTTGPVSRRVRPLLVRLVDQLQRRGLPLSELLPILYPADGRRPEVLTAAEALLGGRDRVRTLSDVHHILSSFDRQTYPSPVSVRLGHEHILWHEEDGLRFALDPDDGALTPFVLDNNFEPHVTAVLRDRCRLGFQAIDVGANVGYHTLRLASLVGPTGSVLAVEANPDNCLLLQAAVEENKLTNVTLLPVGLAQDRGWSYFTTHVGTNGGLLNESSRSVVRDAGTIVPLLRLDEVVGIDQNVDLVKVDVEGAEGLVIAGGVETIARCRPVVVSEFSCDMLRRISGMEPRAYLSLFMDLGYRINVIERSDPGMVTTYGSADDLLADWGSEFRIEDLLFVPS